MRITRSMSFADNFEDQETEFSATSTEQSPCSSPPSASGAAASQVEVGQLGKYRPSPLLPPISGRPSLAKRLAATSSSCLALLVI